MEKARHSVDLPISRTLIALKRVRSLRDPMTNSMPKFTTSGNGMNWETQSWNAGLSGGGGGKQTRYGEKVRNLMRQTGGVEGIGGLTNEFEFDFLDGFKDLSAVREDEGSGFREFEDDELGFTDASLLSYGRKYTDKVLFGEHKRVVERSRKNGRRKSEFGFSAAVLLSGLSSPCYSFDEDFGFTPSISGRDDALADHQRLQHNRRIVRHDDDHAKHMSRQHSPTSECHSNRFGEKYGMPFQGYGSPREDDSACCYSRKASKPTRFLQDDCRCDSTWNKGRFSKGKLSKPSAKNRIHFETGSLSETSSPTLPLLRNEEDFGIRWSRKELVDKCLCNHEKLVYEDERYINDSPHSCTSKFDITSLNDVQESDEIQRSLTQKFRPKSFDELVGQNLVTLSLRNAALKGKIAPIYLFQGPHGTGKTSAARLFAAALNCLSTEDRRPCGSCNECKAISAGKSTNVKEVDLSKGQQIHNFKSLLRRAANFKPVSSHFQIFILEDCHYIPEDLWTMLLKGLEEFSRQVVFICITTCADKLPRTAVSRCQKYHFTKLKSGDIEDRLAKLCMEENFQFDVAALDYVARKSDGSLRDAEMMLEQLSLLGQKITVPLVRELIGVVSDDEILDLLDLALAADISNTVWRVRELMRYRVDPIALVSQLANVVVDILAGKFQWGISATRRKFFHSSTLTEVQLQKLRHALKVLSETERQLRMSKNQTTWLTVALLQLGTGDSLTRSPTNPHMDDEIPSTTFGVNSSRDRDAMNIAGPYWLEWRSDYSGKLGSIWRRTLKNIKSKSLKGFLERECTLSSIYIDKGNGIAVLQFDHPKHASRAEKLFKHIVESLEFVLGCEMEIRINVFHPPSSASHPVTKFASQREQVAAETCSDDMVNCMDKSISSHELPSGRERPKGCSNFLPCQILPCIPKEYARKDQRKVDYTKEVAHNNNTERSCQNSVDTEYDKVQNGYVRAGLNPDISSSGFGACPETVCSETPPFSKVRKHFVCFPRTLKHQRKRSPTYTPRMNGVDIPIHELVGLSDTKEASFKTYARMDDLGMPCSTPNSLVRLKRECKREDKFLRKKLNLRWWRAPRVQINKAWRQRRPWQWRSRLLGCILSCTS